MSSFRPSRSDIVAGLSLVVAILALMWASFTSSPPASNPSETPPGNNTSTGRSSDGVDSSPPVGIVNPAMLGSGTLAHLSHASAQMIARASQSVVRVEHATQGRTTPADDLEIYFGNLPTETMGTGVVVGAGGLVLTSYHVVRGAENIEVRGGDQTTHTAELVGYDPLTDLALLKVPSMKLPALAWGDSVAIARGHWVWAIGSPHGLDQSVSAGIVSSTNRPTLLDSPFQDFIQTDASINPGSSGGPLIDAYGSLVGINTAIAGDSFSGIGFAVPSHIARPVFERLRDHGHVPRGWIGVQLGAVSPRRGAMAGVEAGTGAYIESVASGNNVPALQADLRVADICTQFQGQPVSGPLGLIRAIAGHRIDTTAKLEIVRAGQTLQINVMIVARP